MIDITEKKTCPKCTTPKYLLDYKVIGRGKVSILCKECRAIASYPLLKKQKGVNNFRVF